jgi:hypothetical protein
LQRNWPRIADLGRFDERFRRLWTLYFAWCEAAFLERRVQDRQILLAGADWRDEDRLLGLRPGHGATDAGELAMRAVELRDASAT